MRNLIIVLYLTMLPGLGFTQSDVRLPPSITKGPSQQTVIFRSDDSVTLDCEGRGVPGLRYEWRKDGLVLYEIEFHGDVPNISAPDIKNIRRGADGTMIIKTVTSTVEGFYQCFARNKYGTALSITTRLQRAVLEPSMSAVASTVFQKTVQEGLPFHIQANLGKSFPKAIHGWEKTTSMVDVNPSSLLPTTRIQIAENGDLHFALPEDALVGRFYKSSTHNPYLDIKLGGSYTNITVTKGQTGTIRLFGPTLAFASDTQTVAVIGGSATLRCFFYGKYKAN